MKDLLDTSKMIEGSQKTREWIYPTYNPSATRIEGFGTFAGPRLRIERLERIIEKLQEG